jgi:transcriptional regulator with XRE-family HTH domain
MNAPPTNIPPDDRNLVCAEIGKSLKALRIAANMSQEKLAFRAEVDRTYISLIERGLANPSILALATISFGLGITLADLFASVKVSLDPELITRRSNMAKPKLKPAKSRLR